MPSGTAHGEGLRPADLVGRDRRPGASKTMIARPRVFSTAPVARVLMLAALVLAVRSPSALAQPFSGYDTRSVASPTPEEKLLMLNMLANCEHGPGSLVDPGCQEIDLDGDGDVDLRDYYKLQSSGDAPPLVREKFPPYTLAPAEGTGWDTTDAKRVLIEFHHDQPLRSGTFRILLDTAEGEVGYYWGWTNADCWVHAGDHAIIVDVDRFPPHSPHVTGVRLTCAPSIELTGVRWIIPHDTARISLQWDDGRANNYAGAMALEQINERGTFWVVGSFIGQPTFMTLEQVLELDARGHFIGNHSFTHRQMNVNITEDELYDDFIAMAEWMESVGLTRGARYAALPYGSGNVHLVERLVYEGGFKMVRHTQANTGTWPTFNPYISTNDYDLSIYNRPYFINYLWPESATHMESRWREVIDVCIADHATGIAFGHGYASDMAPTIEYLGEQIQAGNIVHILPDQF